LPLLRPGAKLPQTGKLYRSKLTADD